MLDEQIVLEQPQSFLMPLQGFWAAVVTASHRGPTRGRSMDTSRVVASRKSRALGNPPERAPGANNLTALKLVAQFVGIGLPREIRHQEALMPAISIFARSTKLEQGHFALCLRTQRPFHAPLL